MEFNNEVLQNLSKLARLDLGDHAHQALVVQNLARIVNMIDEINLANTESIEAIAHSIDIAQRTREDVVSEPNNKEAMLALSAKHLGGLFLVPKVIE